MVDQKLGLIDEINKQIKEFKINKEKNESSDDIFINKEENRFWLSLFLKNFFVISSKKQDEDDLLFFIKKKPTKILQQYETKLEVFRKDSKKIPIGELNIDWEETFSLNVIMQKFVYTLVYAVCCRTSSNQMEIIKKHVQRIYPSPSKRTMCSKGHKEEITFPDIYFSIDNYEELIENFSIYNQESICIEVIAKETCSNTLKSIYFGLVDYDSIKKMVENNAFQKKILLVKNKNDSFIKKKYLVLKGPNEKGCGEIAVKQNYNYESLDTQKFVLEDFEWDYAIETFKIKTKRKKNKLIPTNCFSFCCSSKSKNRRMSDPANTLVNFISNWKDNQIKKSKSESKNINDVELEFIEAKDINEELRNEKNFKLWETPGFSQTFFSNKESRKASYPSYNTYLTYLSFSWYQIINDILAPAKKPILLF